MQDPPVKRSDFCATESLRAGDPLAGTGAHKFRNLLISWPSSQWTRVFRKAADMSEATLAGIEAITEGGRRVNLIHRASQPRGRHRLYLMPECLQFDLPPHELPDFLEALAANAPLDRWSPGSTRRPLILCCTHGRKDKCCAKFGNATYRALESAVAEGGHEADVWQSSHLGGCRLAASLMTFPAGRKYGRLEPGQVDAFLHAVALDRPYLPAYRGFSQYSPVRQCAEVACLKWLEARGIDGLVDLQREKVDEEGGCSHSRWHWQAGDREGWLDVTCETSNVFRYDTCADMTGEAPAASRVWRATEVVDAGGNQFPLAYRSRRIPTRFT